MEGRIYDQRTGRFLSADPIFASPFLARFRNGYSYAVNDPINRTDSTGYCVDFTCEVSATYGWGDSGFSFSFEISLGFGNPTGSQSDYSASGSTGSTVDETSTWRPPPEVSPPDNTLYMGAPKIPALQAEMERMMNDPGENWGTRLAAGVLGTAVVPAAVIDRFIINPAINAPWTVHNAGIRIGEHAARAVAFAEHGDGWAVAIEGASLVESAAEGFDAAASVALVAESVVKQAASEFVRPPRPSSRPSGAFGGSCLAPGTRVLMADGSAKAIEDVSPGDFVLAENPDDGSPPAPRQVLQLIQGTTWRLVEIVIQDDSGANSSIDATGEHPFWTLRDGWVAASSLRVGDLLQSPAGKAVRVCAVTERSQYSRTFNLTVADFASYFVVNNDIPVLVHNLTPSLDEKWYWNYLLSDANGSVYYSGLGGPAEKMSDIMYRHRQDGRFLPKELGDQFVELNYYERVTYGEARVIEHVNAVEFNTVNPLERGAPKWGARYNRQAPIGERNAEKYFPEGDYPTCY